MNLSEHFTREELEFSQNAVRLGIENRIPPELMSNAIFLCLFMEQVRTILGAPIHVNSGYRCPQLNGQTPGSAKASAHMSALACDFTAQNFGSPMAVASKISTCGLKFDQLIYEGTWVHISPRAANGDIRNQVLTAKFVDGNPVYQTGLVS
jgi:zinc D-Ala-D-Ala carboxypeptidase